MRTFAQSQKTSRMYRRGIRDLAKGDLPLSNLVGFSIWKALRKLLPETPQDVLYASNIDDDNTLKLLMPPLGSKRKLEESPEPEPNEPTELDKKKRALRARKLKFQKLYLRNFQDLKEMTSL